MILTIVTFTITGIVFFILSLFIDNIWVYYVPCSLLVQSIWLKIIQIGWNPDEIKTAFIQMEPSAAAGYLSAISILYGIGSFFMGSWYSLIICVIVFILSLTMKFLHYQ